MENTNSFIEEINFVDVEYLGADYWARAAIYKMASLGIVKGYGENKFFPSSDVTHAEAITLIYRAMNYEEKAATLAVEIEKKRIENPEVLNSRDTWADGYLKLAQLDGIITEKQFNESLCNNQDLDINKFNKNLSATREEIAYYIAKILRINPVYDSVNLNKYSDFSMVEGKITPFFESVLKERIMKGNGSFLYPKSTITRAEMAQVLENSKSFIYARNEFYEESGKITSFLSGNFGVTKINGDIDYIYILNNAIVIGLNKIGGVELLNKGYKITYVVNSANGVLYIKVDEATVNTEGKPASFFTKGIVQNITYSSITLYSEDGRTNPDLYREFTLSNNVQVSNNKKVANIRDIEKNDFIFLNIADGVVAEISFAKGKELKTNVVGSLYEIDGVYKAVLGYYDSQNSRIVVVDILKLEGNSWVYTNRKGYIEINLDQDSKLYCDNTEITSAELDKYKDKEVFIATGKSTGGNEIVAFLRINLDGSYHSVYDLQISETNGTRFKVKGKSSDYNIDDGTIIIKNNKITSWKDLKKDDAIYTVVKGSGTKYIAAVVYALTYEKSTDFEAFYAYIRSVKVGAEVIVQTIRYYDIKDIDDRYYSVIKTFKLTSNARIVDEDGIVNNRDLSAYSEKDGIRVCGNIVVHNGEILAMGIGEEGDKTLKGRVGFVNREDGNITSFYITSTKAHIGYGNEWEDLENQNLIIANNTIFIKKGKAVSASDIVIGDSFVAYYYGKYINKTAAIIMVN